MSESFDLVVIGAGAAGLVTAAGAARLGVKVALIERHRLGGECLWTGCVPSKALIRSAKIKRLIERADEFGLAAEPGPFNFRQVMEHMRAVIRSIQPHDDPDRFRKMGVEVIEGEARFTSPHEVQVNGRSIRARRFCVATGAAPAVPPIEGVKDVPFLTFETLFELDEQPRSLVIVGGGPIGCEMGQTFHRFGTKVTILETLECILSNDDREVSCRLNEFLVKEGLRIETSARAQKAEKIEDGVRLTCERGHKTFPIEAEKILLATGKKPRVEGMGLEAAGVEFDKKGVKVDHRLRSVSNPRVFACGDVAGSYQFTHYAEHQATVVLTNALAPIFRRSPDTRAVPWCTYTDPELAHVGLREEDARKRWGEGRIRVYRYELSENDRHLIEGEPRGLVKLVTRSNGEILGCTILGESAGELISEYALAVRQRLRASDVSGLIHAYPTLAEANKRASDAFMADKYLGGWIPKLIRWWNRRGRPSPV